MAKPVYTNSQVVGQIDSGAHWTTSGSVATTITYGVTTNNSWFPSYYGEYSGWSALNSKQADVAVTSMELWDDLMASDLNAASNPNSADIRFSNSSTGVSYAHAYYPGVTGTDTYSWQKAQGSVWFNSGYYSLTDPDIGEYGYMAVIHEIGHTIGLAHPGNYNGGSPTYQNNALYEQDTRMYSAMSYFGAWETGADWWGSDSRWHYSQTPMLHDVLTVQSIYGADMTTRSGDTVYGFNSTEANSVFDFSQNLYPVLTIWDGAGNDTLDLSGWNTSSNISLVPGTFSNANAMTYNISIAFGATIENAVGGGGNDVITGNDANNVLNGGAGADALTGGLGDDTYTIDNAGDLITENLGEGVDTVQSSITYTLGANLENLLLQGAMDLNAQGNAGANTINGNAGANQILGHAGNDQLKGWGGDDYLDGGNGADWMVGGTGNDIYVVDNLGDVVTEAAGEGTDWVFAWATPWLGANIENLLLKGATDLNAQGSDDSNTIHGNTGANQLFGNAGSDQLIGWEGNDYLVGGTGVDWMIGGAGNDIYVVDNSSDVVTEAAGEGTDWVFSSATGAIGVNVENMLLQGTADLNGMGNTDSNTIHGNSGANQIFGNAGDDQLIGWEGNDYLVGGAGEDWMVGGTGNDIFVVDNTDDIVTEAAGEGTDWVFSSVTWNLGANVENLLLQGNTDINGTGNADANTILGNTGANQISGNAGDDILKGYEGNDYLVGGLGDDLFIFSDGHDSDTIQDFSAGAGSDDILNIQAFGFANFAAVQAATTNVGADALIQLDADDSVTLIGVQLANLHTDDFLI